MDKIQYIIVKYKIFTSIYLIWVFFNTYLLLATKKHFYYDYNDEKIYDSPNIFAPFYFRDGLFLSWEGYDKSEFFVYTVGPLLLLIIYFLFEKEIQSIRKK